MPPTPTRHVDAAHTFESLRLFASRVRGGLLAHAALAPQAAAWQSAGDDTFAMQVAAMKGDDELQQARGTLRVAILAWALAARVVSDLSAELAAERAPHVPLFHAVSLNEALRLGPAAAAVVSKDVVERGRAGIAADARLGELDEPLAALSAATDRLAAAVGPPDREADTRYAFDLAKAHMVRRLNQLSDETAVLVLRTFPGRSDLVDALFAV